MPATPKISDSEWLIMEVLWRRHPASAVEVAQELNSRTQWQDQTVRTMLRRLIDKGAVGYKAEGKVYYYKPVVSREQCVRVESRSFLERVFGGAAKPLLVQMVQDADLSNEDIAELKKLLAKKEKK
jgi:BlaI family transcriptional regulator, penicillinase repressor